MKRLGLLLFSALIGVPMWIVVSYGAQRTVLTTIGSWRIEKKVDAMTDKTSCIAFYESDPQVQLSTSGFYISLRGRGGVSSIQLRFDGEPARARRLATKMERDISALSFNREEFRELTLAKERLRVEVFTILRSVVNYDIDLTGHLDAINFMNGSECIGG
jgi:hypothetical protein